LRQSALKNALTQTLLRHLISIVWERNTVNDLIEKALYIELKADIEPAFTLYLWLTGFLL
jgi:hypothetical protein